MIFLKMKIILWLIFQCVFIKGILSYPNRRKIDGSGEMLVYLCVSSLAETLDDGVVTQRQLELNWYNGVVAPSDRVALYDHDPQLDPSSPLAQVTPLDYPAGYYRTNITFPRLDLTSLPMQRQCLDYWIGYTSGGVVVSSNCLKLEPSWMWDNRDSLSQLMYRNVMIPGTHDAGSYMYYEGEQSDNIVQRWSAAQEENFWEQLMYGVRDFDLRVSYYPETPEVFWLNHGGVKINPFKDLIDNVKAFVGSTNEIVFLDFHQFPLGFDNHPERHLQLIAYVTQELGQWLLPPTVGYDVTLDQIWTSGKRIIAAYSDSAYNASDLLWPGIPQIWADTMDVDYLKSYMDGYMKSGRSDFWSAQLEMTESASDVLLTSSSLRIMADEVNANVTEWCRDLWWNEANIVAIDFFLGTDIVEVAIQSNVKRAATAFSTSK